MNLTAAAIKYNRVTYTLLFVVVVLGFTAYNQLSRDSMPPYTVRVATIVTSFPGAGPERVELLISDEVEKVAQEIAEVKTITSESRTGLSVVTVELQNEISGNELQPIWDRLRRKVSKLSSSLPENINGPEVNADELGVVYGIMLGLQNNGFAYKEVEDYARDIKDKLIKLPEAAQVEISGLQGERVYVEFNNAQLARFNLSASQLQNIIAGTNIIFPGGDITVGDRRIILEPTGNFEKIEDLEQLLVPIGNGKTVALGDFTRISRGYVTPPEQLVKIDGQRGVGISVALKEGANIINLGESVNNLVEDYQQSLPLGLSLKRIASQDYEVDKSIQGFASNLLQSVAIVLAVMFIFLGMRTGFVVASLIPMAIVTTMFLMGFFNIGLNQVSLAALIMALGMLVDNAIVMAESIMVKMEEGMEKTAAAIESCGELTVPLLISSLTTSAAFLAFFLAESTMGEVVGLLFSVITIALLSSWLLSMTLVPLLAVAVIKVKEIKNDESNGDSSLFDRFRRRYNGILIRSLKRPLLFILIIIIAFLGSIYAFGYIPFTFFPDSERNLVTLDLNLPLGTKIEQTSQTVKQVEAFIEDSLFVEESGDGGITSWSSFVGKGPESYDQGYRPDEANSGYAHILLNTTSGADNQYVIDKLDAFAFQNLPDAEVKVKRLGGGGGSGVPVEIRISGPDAARLKAIAGNVKQKLVAIDGTKNISDDWGSKIIKLVVNINQSKARDAGLTNQDIAVSLRTVLAGFNVGEFREEDDSIPIILREDVSREQSISSLESLTIYAQNSGENVPLSQVANIEAGWQFSKIKRKDLQRTMTVNSYIEENITASDVTEKLVPWLENQNDKWGTIYSYELGGEAESSSEGMGSVTAKLPLSGFIILLLLILQFNSFRKTAIVLSTIPLGIIGVVIGLLIANSYFSFFAFLGIISLAGIVINNAIVLIDRIEIEKEQMGRSPADAVVMAARHRFRPILLTTATTSLGLLPLWFGGGIMWAPMAISIIFGLLFATILTLLFVPVLYSVFYKVDFEGYGVDEE
jgi:multidrug efflux pump subunit AcrB